MNQFQMNRHYVLLWIILLTSIIKTASGQEDDDKETLTAVNDPIISQSTMKPQQLLENSSTISSNNSNKPVNDELEDNIFIKPQQNIFNPTPSLPNYPPNIHQQQFPPLSSDKLFEFSFRKKFFPFGALSLDIKSHKNEPIILQQLQQQQYFPPPSQFTSPNLILPYTESAIFTNNYITKKPSTNYFNNIFNKNYDWGAVIKLPGIAIQKFGKLGFNIFGGSTSSSSLLQSNQIHNGNIGLNNGFPINGHSNHGLITGQMPSHGLLDEKVKSKIA